MLFCREMAMFHVESIPYSMLWITVYPPHSYCYSIEASFISSLCPASGHKMYCTSLGKGDIDP